MSQRVFRICHRDGNYVCVGADLISKNGSWWHVRHSMGDGKTLDKNYNGGTTRGLRRMHVTIMDAWLAELDILALEASGPIGPRDRVKMLARLSRCAECMWREAVQAGTLFGELSAHGHSPAEKETP